MYSKKQSARRYLGVTLLEILLVLALISIIFITGIRYYQQKLIQDKVDKSALDIQQILTAAMTFYVAKGVWPTGISCMKGDGTSIPNSTAKCDMSLLPTTPNALSAPWALAAGGLTPYNVGVNTNDTSDPKFYVSLPISSKSYPNTNVLYAQMISNKLPLGYTTTTFPPPAPPATVPACTTGGTTCTAVVGIMPPGQSLSNAGNLNYSGVYYHGGCIPVPECPMSNPNDPTSLLQPQVFVVPVSVSGFVDSPTSGNPAIYPITSFTAYVTPQSTLGSQPAGCNGTTTAGTCPNIATSTYWRACLDIQTQQTPSSTSPWWAQKVGIAAFTRCQPGLENTGNGLKIYDQ